MPLSPPWPASLGPGKEALRSPSFPGGYHHRSKGQFWGRDGVGRPAALRLVFWGLHRLPPTQPHPHPHSGLDPYEDRAPQHLLLLIPHFS